LQKKKNQKLLISRLDVVREKHLKEAEDRYNRFAIDRKRVMTEQTENVTVLKECKNFYQTLIH
jgi:hypothetical protein